MKLWIPQESSSPTKFVFMDSQITKIYISQEPQTM